VEGGSGEYKKRLIQPWKNFIRINAQVETVIRDPEGVSLRLSDGETLQFDKVLIATHADQALSMLQDASPRERKLLAPFQYQKNRATLHTDATVMPKLKKVWSSWNYRSEILNGRQAASCHYWMNNLQGISGKNNYFVSINDTGLIRGDRIIREFIYDHPIFTVDAMKTQPFLQELNGNGRVFFCGSYFRYGFHEDALQSAADAVDAIRNTQRAMTGT
jgi:predicted NAD/FAD-binding protein